MISFCFMGLVCMIMSEIICDFELVVDMNVCMIKLFVFVEFMEWVNWEGWLVVDDLVVVVE